MIRPTTAILCVFLLLQPAFAQAKAPAGPSIKEQALLIPVGSIVEVKLQDKRKIRGRIGQATDEGFSVQHVRDGKVVDEKVAFQEVKSIKQREQGMSTAAKVGLGVAAGAGGLLVILLILAATAWD